MPINKNLPPIQSWIFGRNFVKRFNLGVWIITLVNLFNAIGFSICLPFLALYLYQERGLSMSLVGTVILIGGLFTAITQIFGGILSDKIGRRPLILWTMAISTILYVGLAILINVAAPIWSIVIVYLSGRAAAMAMRPATSAIIADLTPKNRLTETYGLLRVGVNLGWAAGPAIGGYLLTFLPYAWLFGLAALTSTIALWLVFFFLRESFHGSGEQISLGSLLSITSNRILLTFIGLSFLVMLVYGQLISTLSVYTVDRVGFSTAQYGFLLTLNGLMVFLFQYPMARFITRLAKYKALVLGSLLYSFGYLLFAWVGDFSLALVAMGIITVGEIINAPTMLSVVGELAPRNQRGLYMGVFTLTETLGFSVGPLIGGVLLDVFPSDPIFIWGIIALLPFAAAAGYLRWGASQSPHITLSAKER